MQKRTKSNPRRRSHRELAKSFFHGKLSRKELAHFFPGLPEERGQGWQLPPAEVMEKIKK